MDKASGQLHAPLFTLPEVLQLEHRAWHGSDGDLFHYDGILFWRGHDGQRRAARPEDLPREGWWHRIDCTCTACRSHRGEDGDSPEIDNEAERVADLMRANLEFFFDLALLPNANERTAALRSAGFDCTWEEVVEVYGPPLCV